MNLFTNGYALLIGVNTQEDERLKDSQLPGVEYDIKALANVLKHPERCAYKPENVRILLGEDATKKSILEGLGWLRQKVAEDQSGNASAFIYYSGHGHLDKSNSTPQYYLIPYDVLADPYEFDDTVIQDSMLTRRIASIQANRLLFVLDCCHAGGTQSKIFNLNATVDLSFLIAEEKANLTDKDVTVPPPPPPGNRQGGSKPINLGGTTKDGTVPLPPPPGNRQGGSKPFPTTENAKGRAILASSQQEEKSYMRQDGKMSIFTQHLIEALTGHAQPNATEVLVTDIMSYVTRKVPESAAQQGRQQHPTFRLEGDSFPVALLLGGKGLGAGQEAPSALETPAYKQKSNAQTVSGEGSIGVQGSIVDTINTGTIIHGNQTNHGDKTIHGHEIHGDYVGGDKFTGDKVMGNKSTGSKETSNQSSGEKNVSNNSKAIANWLEEVRDLVMDADIASALATFLEHNQDKLIEDSLIILTSRWNGLRKSKIKGTIMPVDANIETNQIKMAIQELSKDAERRLKRTRARETWASQEKNKMIITKDGNIQIERLSGGVINIIQGDSISGDKVGGDKSG